MTDSYFSWEDPLLLDEQLTEDERLVYDMVQRFAHQHLMPVIVDWNRREIFDRDLFLQFGELGLLGGTIEGYGCPGLSHVCYGLACRAFEGADTAFRSAIGVQSGLAMAPIYLFGSEEQKRKFLPVMAKGEIIGCFGLTEPDHGSDPSGMKSRATKVDGGWQLTGNKTWITNAPISDICIVWAKDEQGVVNGFIVDSKTKGVNTPKIEGKFGARASPTGEIAMDEVFVANDHRLPNALGLKAPLPP